MTKDFLAALHDRKDWGTLFLRIVVGGIFLYSGLMKFGLYGVFSGAPLSGFAGMLGSLGFPLPIFFSALVATVETIGGLFLILGFLTRYSGVALLITMLVATIVTFPQGMAMWQFPFVLFWVNLLFVFSGAGRYSLDRRMLLR